MHASGKLSVRVLIRYATRVNGIDRNLIMSEKLQGGLALFFVVGTVRVGREERERKLFLQLPMP